MRRSFFIVTGVLMLVLTMIGFSDNLFTDVGQPSNRDPKFIVHGLLCGAWMVVLMVQAMLAGRGRLALHRSLGMAAFWIAIGVTLSTIWVFVAVWKDWALMSAEVKANRLLLPSYSLFVALAFHQRRRPDLHKRLIYTGTLFMLGPVLARSYDRLLVPLMTGWSERQIDDAFLPCFFTTWTAFFIGLAMYDLKLSGRLHRVTLVASGWFVLVWLYAFGASSGW